MLDTKTMMDLTTQVTRPEAEPKAIQIDAWIGDLYIGQRTYYNATVKKALRMATDYIRINGRLL
jgi:hypothetical protein